MPQTEPAQTVNEQTDMHLRKLREYITASLAFIIVVLYPVAIWLAADHFGDPQNNYSLLKDLLLLFNTILGFVLGYYFNKVSTEARAENAEATAKQAVLTAQQASEERNLAVAEVEMVEERVEEARQALDEMGEMMEQMEEEPSPGTLSGAESTQFSERDRQELLRAWSRAKRALEL